MKLTIQDIFLVREVLRTTGEFQPDGRPVAKTYSGLDLSAIRWFEKNTKEVTEAYNKFLDEKRVEMKKEKAEEIKEEAEVMKNLRNQLKAFKKEETEDAKEVAGLLSNTLSTFTRMTVAKKIDGELGKQEDVLKKFREDEHEIEMSDKTKAVIQRELGDAKFTADESFAADTLEKFA